MNRYLSSFFITFCLYAGFAYTLFIVFADEKIIIKKSEPLKTISLNHIELKKEIIKPKEITKPKEIVEPKRIEPKKIKPKKIVKKKVIKEKVVEKKVIKEKVVEKKVIKKTIEKQEAVVEKRVIKKTVPTVPAKKVDVKKDYLIKHLAQVRKHIMQNTKYSKRAKRLRIQDVVKVKFTLLSSGKVKNIQILSGNKHLHKSAITAVKKASSSFPKVSKDIDIIIPIKYQLI